MLKVLQAWARRRMGPGIAGVLWEGSTARGVADPEAGIDVRVVWHGPTPDAWPGGEGGGVLAGRMLHVRHTPYAELDRLEWTPFMRYAFATSRTLVDNRGRLRALLTRHLEVDNDKRRDEALFWYCELRAAWSDARRAAARRDWADCAYSLGQVAEATMRCHFGCTESWVPYRRWLVHEFLACDPPQSLRVGVLSLLAIESCDAAHMVGKLAFGRQMVENCRDRVAKRFTLSRGRLDGWDALRPRMAGTP